VATTKQKEPSAKRASPLLLGPAGVPENAPRRDTKSGITRVAEVGLGCMELEFVRGVSMGEKKAAQVNTLARQAGISLSVHAPYYINFNSTDREVASASKRRLFEAARIGALCGARSIAFHPGYYMGESPSKTLRRIEKNIRDVGRMCAAEGIAVQLRPETTGRPSQFGHLDEVLTICSELDGVLPCIDFAHMHAYEGGMNSYDEFASVLDAVRARLGSDALADMHMHVSGIHYGPKGELKHLNLAESDFDYVALLRALKDYSVGGRLVCESPDREADALMMKIKYGRMRQRKR
jgi:deoxyribonuclease-4